MSAWFASWLVSPWLLGLGALLVSIPIIIHLLNRRRFRTIDWAAMDFLLEAERKNRRRVQLENLILLLLRCLAVLLLGLLLARPFSQLLSFSETEQFERIVVIDDSLSMQAAHGNADIMSKARESIANLVRSLAENESDDLLTVVLTSDPSQRLFNAEPVNADNVEELLDEINAIQAADTPANLDVALQELEDTFANQRTTATRVVYLVTDLRKRDWDAKQKQKENQPLTILGRIAEPETGEGARPKADVFVVDVGDDESANLAIVDIRPEDMLVTGVSNRFNVSIANYGTREAKNVRIEFNAGEAPPISREVASIAPAKTETVPFTFTFAAPQGIGDDPVSVVTPVKVTVQVFSGNPGEEDRLSADSSRYYPARVAPGITTLVVDGDPSTVYGRAESFFLEPALSPPGRALSGLAIDVVTETQFETTLLTKYRVIYLCNLYRPSENMVASLRKWVAAGGGLVILPGDQVEDDYFNQLFCDGPEPLSPISLVSMEGDEDEQSWKQIRPVDELHDVMQVFAGENNPFVNNIKIFRWWVSDLVPPPKTDPSDLNATPSAAGPVQVIAKITDDEESPAVAERTYGKGRVIAFAFPGDADWSNWPDDPSYLVAVQILTRYMNNERAAGGDLRVGEPIQNLIDLTEHKRTATLNMPGETQSNLRATQLTEGDENETIWQVSYPRTVRQGFYELELKRNDDTSDTILFAANTEAGESDLTRVKLDAFKSSLTKVGGVYVEGDSVARQTVGGAQNEWWKTLLLCIIGVLALEQFLGWLFGRNR